MESAYLRTADAAKYLGIGKSTLERARIEGDGPYYRRLGAKVVVYAKADLDVWASESIFKSTAEEAE